LAGGLGGQISPLQLLAVDTEGLGGVPVGIEQNVYIEVKIYIHTVQGVNMFANTTIMQFHCSHVSANLNNLLHEHTDSISYIKRVSSTRFLTAFFS
jgi:hypothetical protein